MKSFLLVLMGLIGVWHVSVSVWTIGHDGGLLLFGRTMTGEVVRQTKELNTGKIVDL